MLFAVILAAAVQAGATAEPAPGPAAPGPMVVLETSMGAIRIKLHQDKAPVSVANFLKYVRAGHYDGTIFHRVIPGFMIQGGGFEPDMTQRTQTLMPPIKNEAKNGLRNRRGTLAMARTNDPHSATAQFFVSVKDNAFLDFGTARDGWGYTVFAEVVEGMDVADKIAAVPTGTKGTYQDVPRTAVVIKTAREAAAPKPKAPAPAPAPASPKP